MIFGDRGRFAIQYVVDANHGGAWMFGYFCYWLNEDCIGDLGLLTSLRDILFQLERISCDAGKRQNSYLMQLETEELHQTVHDSMYGVAEDTPEQRILEQRAIDEEWACHDISPGVDTFDEWNLYLVENETIGRIVVFSLGSNEYKEYILNNGEFDAVLKQALYSLMASFEEVSESTYSVV